MMPIMGDEGGYFTGRKEESIIHQKELFHFSSMI